MGQLAYIFYFTIFYLTQAEGVVVVSGDRHVGAFYRESGGTSRGRIIQAPLSVFFLIENH
jgi:hypothetical protein